MSAPEETSLGRNEDSLGGSGQGVNTSHSSNSGGSSETSQRSSSQEDSAGVRNRNVNQGDSSSAPPGNVSNQHSLRVTRNAPVIPPVVTDASYQHQIRVVLVLVIALTVGFLYLQLEHQTLSPTRFKLIPTTTYEALQNIQKQPRPTPAPKPPLTPNPESDLADNEDDESETESFIPEKFQLQAKYLSKVLQTIGDLSRKIEVGENITKPIGGIIEMRTEILKTEEEEDVPEYMKELGSIINDIKKAKTPAGKRLPKFKPTIKKTLPPPPPAPKPKPTEAEERRRRQKEWDSFMDDLVEALYEEEQEEKLKKGIVDEPPVVENKAKRLSIFDDDEENDEFDLDEEDDEYPPEHYEQIAKNPSTREIQKIFENVIEEEEKERQKAYDEYLDRESQRRSTIFDDNKEIQESLALLKLMVEARKFVKAAKAMNEAQSKEEEELNQAQEDGDSKKPRFQDDNSYTL